MLNYLSFNGSHSEVYERMAHTRKLATFNEFTHTKKVKNPDTSLALFPFFSEYFCMMFIINK